MLDHVSITVSDLEKSRPFWDAVMAALGVPLVWEQPDAVGYGVRNSAADDARTYITVRQEAGDAYVGQGRHWCFRAPHRPAVDAFHAAGVAHGGTSDGAPGLRPGYHAHYYAAFLRDADGNRVEAVCHRPSTA